MKLGLLGTAIIAANLVLAVFSFGEELKLDVSWSRRDIRQGDAVLVKVQSPVKLTSLNGRFGGRRVFFKGNGVGDRFTGLLGIDMLLPAGKHRLVLKGKGTHGQGVLLGGVSVKVGKRKYKVERITLPKETVELSEKALRRAEKEAAILKAIWERSTRERLWRGKFSMPVQGRVKPNFGNKRILNGKRRSPHSGVDIGAPEGREIRSPNRGKVVLTDNHYFGGKTVVVDHGQGLYSVYLHMSKIMVKQGSLLNRGDLIGLVGETGRAKGAHLHWSVRLNKARIDPLTLLNLSGKRPEAPWAPIRTQ